MGSLDADAANRGETVSEVAWHLVPREFRMLICRVDAGFPSPAADDLEEPIDLAAWLVQHPAASYVMRVQGWSMAGASISDGDHVVVDRSVEPMSGSIVVALLRGDRTLKRLKRRGDRMWLLPEPLTEGEYPETLVDENVEIWGVVTGLARRYR